MARQMVRRYDWESVTTQWCYCTFGESIFYVSPRPPGLTPMVGTHAPFRTVSQFRQLKVDGHNKFEALPTQLAL